MSANKPRLRSILVVHQDELSRQIRASARDFIDVRAEEEKVAGHIEWELARDDKGRYLRSANDVAACYVQAPLSRQA